MSQRKNWKFLHDSYNRKLQTKIIISYQAAPVARFIFWTCSLTERAVASEQDRKLDPSLKRSLINPLADALIATFEIRKAVQKKNLDFVLKSRTHPPVAGAQGPQSENLKKKSILHGKKLPIMVKYAI